MSGPVRLPIRTKLTRVILLTCSVVLLLACGVLAAYELFDFRRAMARDMTVLADVIATNTTAALAFQDETSARETLSALEVEPYVTTACLYGLDGTVFVTYRRPLAPEGACPTRVEDGVARFIGGRLSLFRPVVLDGRRIGTIYVEASLAAISERLLLFGGIAAVVLLGSMAVAFVISSRLQRPISGPILSLAETARAIAEGKDYSARASAEGTQEVGVLTDAFNSMVGTLHDREAALRAANDSLLGEIAERKAAENRVRSQLARLELLNQITRAIGERQDLQSIFQVVVSAMEEHLPVDFTCICLHEPKENVLDVAAVGRQGQAVSVAAGLRPGLRLEIAASGLARCLQGELVYEPDILGSPHHFPRTLSEGGLRAMVVAPLLVEKTVFGLLIASRREPGSFSSAECEFLRQLSDHTALAAHQAQLHGALQGAYDDLRQTQQAVLQQERLRALGQMASGIAHDINNAISPVALYTESLLENEPNLSAKARGYLTTIQGAIEDVAQTVTRLREFYRHREPQLQLSPVRLNPLVQQVADLSRARWRDMALSKGIVITLAQELAADLPTVMGIESEIREALVNLVFNAVDAMPSGGTLTLRTELTRDSRSSSARGRARILVQDTGVGMDEDTRRRCLEPFFTTKGERGTGLGLAMVYGVVQRHNAELTVDSVVRQGTTIGISFEVPQTPVATESSPPPAVVLPNLRLLVVDDDPLLIASLRETLTGDGHEVVTADGGQAGIDAFAASLAGTEPFAAVITDLGMPFVDGRKVAAAVKGASFSTPVIMLTGWGQRLTTEGDIPPHVDFLLNKPPRLKDLRDALARSLGRQTG